MKRFRLALLSATLILTTVLGAAPALADGSTDWDHSRGFTFPPEVTEAEIARLALPDPAGSACTAVLSVTNPDSEHPGNILKLYQGAMLLLSIPGFEDQAGTLTDSTGFVATGEDLIVAIERGRHRTTSSLGSLTVTCEPPDTGGGEGCTPGYWKQPHHFDSWVATGYSPADDFDTVFGLDPGTTEWTLLDGVSAKGGKQNALARHGVAALLNSSNPDVSYGFSAADVISKVQQGFDTENWNFYKDQLEGENEAGCPLN